MDRLHFNFRRKSKGTSLAQWLIPSRFQFPALESQGIRLLQRRILAGVNVFCPSFILDNGEAFLALCCRCQPLFPFRKTPIKHPIPKKIKQLLFRKCLTLQMSVSWCSKSQTRGSKTFSLRVSGIITAQCCQLLQSEPHPDAPGCILHNRHPHGT